MGRTVLMRKAQHSTVVALLASLLKVAKWTSLITSRSLWLCSKLEQAQKSYHILTASDDVAVELTTHRSELNSKDLLRVSSLLMVRDSS